MKVLGFDFYNRPADVVARELLGKRIFHRLESGEVRSGVISETEAYLGPHDLAAHSSKGLTKRTQALYGEAGRIYMYLIYGIHVMANITTGPEGSAVLLRALIRTENIPHKTTGPGLVAKGLGLELSDYGAEVNSDTSSIWLGNELYPKDSDIIVTPRIGVDYAKDWVEKPLRFVLKV